MWERRARAAMLAVSLLAGAARADDLADFHAAVENVAAHNRVALGYLRTENADLAAIELERMREAWGALASRFAQTPPAQLQGNPLYAATFVDVPIRIDAALMMVDAGHLGPARDSLLAVRNAISTLRRTSRIEVLADCVLDANAAMDALIAYRDSPPDWTIAGTGEDVAAKARAYAGVIRRCDGMASASIRQSEEFRRLIDGALASIALVPEAVSSRDNALLHRILIELRSFDNLLAFRFG
jgi:hypothetical protein